MDLPKTSKQKCGGVFFSAQEIKTEGLTMDLQYHLTEEKLTIVMPAEVDHHVAQHMSREVDCLIDSWHIRTLVFDFAGTEFMDSSGIGVLIGRKKNMDLHGGCVRAANLSGRAMQLFEKSGLTQIIEMDERDENASMQDRR